MPPRTKHPGNLEQGCKHGNCILLFTLYCRIFRGERLSPGGWMAVALDIIGIALLSCGQATRE